MSAAVAAKAASIDAAQARPLTWKSLVRSALLVVVAGLAIYLVLPKLIAVLGTWPRLSTLNPAWFAVALAAELLSFTCNFALQRLALRTSAWFPVVTAGLAGNAVTNSLPGGEAAGAAVQFGMLTTAGFDTGTAVGGLTAFSLLGIGGLLAAQRLRNWVTRGRRPTVTGLDRRLLDQRDTIRRVLDRKWWQAALLTAGRLGFDYGCLLAALCATGASPQPSMVLLAYAAAGIVALLPLTPGGLGIVEASLSGLLVLAGVRAGYAVLAILAYRIASYWLPLLAGPPAYLLFRHRYGRPVFRRAADERKAGSPR